MSGNPVTFDISHTFLASEVLNFVSSLQRFLECPNHVCKFPCRVPIFLLLALGYIL